MRIVLACTVGLALSSMALGIQDWDPTSPADTAKQQGAAPKHAGDPLAGPDVEPETGASGRGASRGPGMQMGGEGVQALLANRCGSCHGAKKQKGGVRVTPIDALFEGDERDWVIVPGKPQNSELYKRIILPKGHDDVMPPEDEPLSEAEVIRIQNWIAQNATKEMLIEASGPLGGGKANAVDPRTWAAVYLSLDLTDVQRKAAMTSLAELRTLMQKQRRGGGRGMGGGQADQPRPGSAEAGEARREMQQQRQAMKQKISEAQEALWATLSPTQQAAMRATLEDPEAVKKAKRAQGGRGPGGERRAGRRPGGRPQ